MSNGSASSLTDAPPFREIAKNYDPDELVDGFMDGLAVRHPLMPDVPTFAEAGVAWTAAPAMSREGVWMAIVSLA